MTVGEFRTSAFGIPVTIRPGFWLFSAALFVVSLVNSWQFAAWLVAGTMVLNLCHEFGHALAARFHGATAAITLDAVAGRTHYAHGRPLKTRHRLSIVAAGPITHIVLGLAIVRIGGANPFSLHDAERLWFTHALWWAGPFLGAMNLLPIVPLDGGMLLATAIDRVRPGRGMVLARWVSTALFAGASTWAIIAGRSPLGITLAMITVVCAAFALYATVSAQPAGSTGVSRSPHVLLIESLVAAGRHAQAGTLGSRAFEHDRDPALAVLIARAAGALGDTALSVAWLCAAIDAGGEAEALDALESAVELDDVRRTAAADELADRVSRRA